MDGNIDERFIKLSKIILGGLSNSSLKNKAK